MGTHGVPEAFWTIRVPGGIIYLCKHATAALPPSCSRIFLPKSFIKEQRKGCDLAAEISILVLPPILAGRHYIKAM